jgi:predicted HTH transcriptional regulator
VIPSDERLFVVENYKEFLGQRRQAIAERLNEFLAGFTDKNLSPAPPSLEELIARGESDVVEFKSSLRWDIVTDKLNKGLEDVVMKSVSAFANTKGGVLLIGVNDGGQILGLNKDYASMDGGNRDKFERHLRQRARDKFGVSYTSSQLNCDFNEVKGLQVCKITVRPAPQPLVMKVVDKNGQATERLYVRNGNASQELPVSEMHDYIKNRFA